MKKIAVILRSPLSEVFGLSGASFSESYDTREEFDELVKKVSLMHDVGMVIVSYGLEERALSVLKNKIVVGV